MKYIQPKVDYFQAALQASSLMALSKPKQLFVLDIPIVLVLGRASEQESLLGQ